MTSESAPESLRVSSFPSVPLVSSFPGSLWTFRPRSRWPFLLVYCSHIFAAFDHGVHQMSCRHEQSRVRAFGAAVELVISFVSRPPFVELLLLIIRTRCPCKNSVLVIHLMDNLSAFSQRPIIAVPGQSAFAQRHQLLNSTRFPYSPV